MSRMFARGGAEHVRRPKALVGQFEGSGVLVLDLAGVGSSMRLGGARASINRYRSRFLVTGVPVDELRSSNLYGVQLNFPGLLDWIGSATSRIKTEFHKDGRQRGITIVVDPASPTSMPLNDLTLELGMHWQLDGPDDRRTLYAPFYVGVRSAAPIDVLDLMEPILHMQDLLSLAYRGFMRADGGRATLDLAERPGSSPEVWSQQTMAVPRGGAEPKSRSALPSFTMATLGGAEAIPKWITLARTHPRLTEPVVDRFRHGPVSVGTYLREICAAIEYWRAANVRQLPWADEKFQPLAVANSLGQPFADWLGVPLEEWCSKLWEAYNSSKHLIARSEAREEDVGLLATSAAVMLTAVALQEASVADWTVESFLDTHWNNTIQSRVRETFS